MTKYIGPKTEGENVATQADKLSLSSETPDVLTPDQTGAAGTATTAARSDHQHEILAGTPGTISPDDTATEGSSTSFARADHRHAIAAASAGTITGTNAEGTSTSFARADHDHAIGVEWTAHTPVLQASTTNPTAGTGGTRVGRYIQIGKIVTYQFLYQFGSGMNAGAGIYRLVLPVTASRTKLGGNFTAGTVRLFDNNANDNIQLNFFVHDADTYIRMAWFPHADGANDVTATSPWTWQESDVITGTITYEAA